MRSLIKVFNGVTAVNTELNTGMEGLQGPFRAFPLHSHIRLVQVAQRGVLRRTLRACLALVDDSDVTDWSCPSWTRD